MEQKHIRVVRGSFIAVIIFVVSVVMTRLLETTAPVWMGLVLFGIYLVAEWSSANLGRQNGAQKQAATSAVSVLSSRSGGAIAGLAFVIGVVVIAVAFFGLKTTA